MSPVRMYHLELFTIVLLRFIYFLLIVAGWLWLRVGQDMLPLVCRNEIRGSLTDARRRNKTVGKELDIAHVANGHRQRLQKKPKMDGCAVLGMRDHFLTSMPVMTSDG